MDLRQQHNVRENNAAHQAPQQPQYHPTHPAPQQQAGNNSWWWPSLGSKILVGLTVVAAIVVLIAFAVGTFGSKNHPLASQVDSKGWQAVFLSNGQVYFGMITQINDQIMILEDIYYLQVDQQIQPEQDGQEANPESNLSLAKLGVSELHAPQDKMFISMDEVIFWENLKDAESSRVVKAIEDYKASEQEVPAEQQTAPPAQSGQDEVPTTEDTTTEPIEP